MKVMKKILLVLLSLVLMAFQCESDEPRNCNCEKILYIYQPPMSSAGVTIPARYDYVRSIYGYCGETSENYIVEYGADYNRYKLICD